MESTVKTKVEFKVSLELTEAEARAFEAIIGYGWEPFAKFFYEKLGSSYLKPYEAAAKALFNQRQNIIYQLYNIEQVRKAVASINTNPGLDIEPDIRQPVEIK
jgi:hypothetical protein